ncbi:MAG TPA: flagellar assembly protein FliW [Firmicutes bacterium]|nr:flagellar assembly protein FliW [Bacillota bacterium]
MQVKSTRFGQFEVPEEKVLTFPDGLLGFEASKRFVILDHAPETPFKWLQSVDDPDLAFVIINPAEFMPDYAVELGRDDVVKLGLKDASEAAVYVVVVIPEDPSAMTANLQGPLVVNAERRLGRQVVLADGRYRTRHPILAELQSARAAEPSGKAKPRAKAGSRGPAVALAR